MYFPCKHSDDDDDDQEDSIVELPEIDLPWDLAEWEIEVTVPVSTTEIWARLIENDFKVIDP